MRYDLLRKNLVYGIIMLFFISGIIPNTVRNVSASNDTGLVGYWSFDEGSRNTAYDSAGNNDGAIYGATWTTGISGKALSFDGNDYALVDDDSDLDFGTGDFSLSVWIKPSSSEYLHIIGKDIYSGDSVNGYYLQQSLSGSNNRIIRFATRDAASEFGPGPVNYLDSGKTITTGEWTHIVGVRKSNVLYLYINSELDSSLAETSITDVSTDVDFKIGRFDENTAHLFKGSIDEVKIYNRALTASEIQEHYEEYMPYELVAYWNFNEGSGSIASDSSGYENHGTRYGATWTDGVSNGALSFDGSGDYVSVPDSSNLDFGINDFTVEFWVNFKDLQYNDNGLIHKDNFAGSLSNTKGWLFNTCEDCGTAYSYGTGSAGVGLETRSKSNDIGSDTHSRYATSNFHLNTWYHIVGVRDSNVLYLYVDGVLRAITPEDTPADLSNDIELRIGSLSPTSPQFFNGIIDEVRIYNRALTASEIKSQFNEFMKVDNTVDFVNFSDYKWIVRPASSEPEGPGGNNWSNSTENVWVDSEDNLHLNLTYIDGTWYCSEVYTEKSFEYGTYTFYVASRVDNLPKNVVVGLFTYEYRGESTPKEYEIDIEFSTWNDEIDENGQYVYQFRVPDDNLEDDDEPNLVIPHRFLFTLTGDYSTHKFIWRENYLDFESYHGHYDNRNELPSDKHLIANKTWDDSNTIYNIPPDSDEKVYINIWCYNGYPSPDTDSEKIEFVIKEFKFTPLSDGNGDDGNGTPGFELILVLVAIGLIYFIKRKNRR